jgi:aspartate kinase
MNDTNIVVQKFGGTSIATPDTRQKVVEKIIGLKAKGNKPVVVVSAMGRSGDPYATDTLMNQVLTANAQAKQRDLDIISSCGEIISGVVLANLLISKGHDAVFMTGGQAGIITDSNFGKASILKIDPSNIIEAVNSGKIPVVAGFQGTTEKGEVTTLGRGGSDTTAAAVAAALRAKAVEIYTDVDGIMSADPKVVGDARLLTNITYFETLEMANNGAKVIHPRAVGIAMENNIPMYIKNSFNDNPGSCISNTIKAGKTVTAVASLPGVSQITLEFPDFYEKESELKFFELLADEGISIDLINIFPDRKVFTIDSKHVDTVVKHMETGGLRYSVLKRCAKVTAIGAGITGVPGIMANIMRALAESEVKILQTSDSLITISCLVPEEDRTKAVKSIHDKFNLGG